MCVCVCYCLCACCIYFDRFVIVKKKKYPVTIICFHVNVMTIFVMMCLMYYSSQYVISDSVHILYIYAGIFHGDSLGMHGLDRRIS